MMGSEKNAQKTRPSTLAPLFIYLFIFSAGCGPCVCMLSLLRLLRLNDEYVEVDGRKMKKE